MASGRRRSSSSCFDNLPDDVLGRIETFLDFKSRLAFFSCCRAPRAYQTAATGISWPEVQYRLRKPKHVQALAAWLARNRQHLGTLKLIARFLPPMEDGYNVAALKQSGAEAVQGIMPALGALAGSSAHTLSVEVLYGDLQVGDWVLRLTQLESLFLDANKLSISADLSSLTRLTSLSFESWEHMNIPAGMPPHLRRLTLVRFNVGPFRACAMAAGALPQLQELTLNSPYTEGAAELPWDWLPLRTSLTALTLGGCYMEALPAQLAALTGLRQLAVQHSHLSPTDEALEPLAALTGLTSLKLSWLRWESIPALVFRLPLLKELDISCNKAISDRPLAGSSSLTKLVLDAGLALAAPRQLVHFPALHTLCLQSVGFCFPWNEVEVEHDAVELLLGELSRHPRIAVLDLTRVYERAWKGFDSSLRVLGLEHSFDILVRK